MVCPKKEEFTIEEIKIHIVRKKIKNMYLTVRKEDGSVEVRVPMKMSFPMVERFVRSKMDWIKKHQERFANMEHPVPLQYKTGEKILFFGKQYELQIEENYTKNEVTFDGETIQLYLAGSAKKETCEALLDQWYRVELAKKLPFYFDKWEAVMGVHAKEVRIRKMKTRWGTCNTRVARIWISLELAKKPEECLEYIVVHELAHLLEPSHNRIFYAYMTKFLPDWKERKVKLNQC